MIYLKLFWAFFQIGLLSIGGGYAAMPLIQNQVVDTYGWLNMDEFANVITISQMTPGPIAINSATFVGIRIAGIWGAVIATVGCILPSCAIVLLLAILYRKYKNLKYVQGVLKSLHPAVVGMIASAGFAITVNTLWNGEAVSHDIGDIDFVSVALIAACIFSLKKIKINPTFVMLGAGIAGGIIYSLI
ncbi:putative chromate transport protein [Oxobacter pfennigii]|uniref:Putative chromate transport protein n=1 Tax=Oxobacter pfennigii TaxID=36849 RepID=A0A0N8NSP0_9CLOT|nr:chromate transporter [Oxobacter pfennigii]KPU42568.1 putative chromate transport protein [Oxobacter pfennigii]